MAGVWQSSPLQLHGVNRASCNPNVTDETCSDCCVYTHTRDPNRRPHSPRLAAPRLPPEHTPLLLFNVPVRVGDRSYILAVYLVTDCPFFLWVWSGFLGGAALSSSGSLGLGSQVELWVLERRVVSSYSVCSSRKAGPGDVPISPGSGAEGLELGLFLHIWP